MNRLIRIANELSSLERLAAGPSYKDYVKKKKKKGEKPLDKGAWEVKVLGKGKGESKERPEPPGKRPWDRSKPNAKVPKGMSKPKKDKSKGKPKEKGKSKLPPDLRRIQEERERPGKKPWDK